MIFYLYTNFQSKKDYIAIASKLSTTLDWKIWLHSLKVFMVWYSRTYKDRKDEEMAYDYNSKKSIMKKSKCVNSKIIILFWLKDFVKLILIFFNNGLFYYDF